MNAINLEVDVCEAFRQIIHVEADLPVNPGRNEFTTPLWIAESHVANGPVASIAGLYFSVDGRNLKWRRDPIELYIYIVDVPDGTSSVHVSFDAVGTRYVTRRMLMLLWETVLIHHAHIPVRDQRIHGSIIVPPGWRHATSLRTKTDNSNNRIHFAETSVYTLEDSPVLIGQYVKELPIAHNQSICVAGSEDVQILSSTMAKMRRLVAETRVVFGDLPYGSFRFLILLSKHLAPQGQITAGMEHSESCFVAGPANLLSDPDVLNDWGDTLSHEYSHVWNGKYLRPEGHLPSDFTTPLDGKLLWVYEGLTTYYGGVLAVRAGIMTPSSLREKVAKTAAEVENTPGRRWRSTEDTGTGVALGRGGGMGRSMTSWGSWLRASDYYMEGVLIWLEVDAIIRQTTNRSLDDFVAQFFQIRKEKEATYTLDEMVACLNAVAEYDWHRLFKSRVVDVDPQVNIRGINRAGYDYIYSSEPSEAQLTDMGEHDMIWSTFGVKMNADGVVQDVRRFSVADKAKIAPTQVLKQSDGARLTQKALADAIREADNLSIVIEHQEDSWTVNVRHGGARYPKLQRRDGPDILAAIIAPRCDVDVTNSTLPV